MTRFEQQIIAIYEITITIPVIIFRLRDSTIIFVVFWDDKIIIVLTQYQDSV
jgi:hypothetical protein